MNERRTRPGRRARHALRVLGACGVPRVFLVLLLAASIAALYAGPSVAAPTGSRPGLQAEQDTRTKHLEEEAVVDRRAVRVDATASSLEISVGAGDRLRVVADLEYWSNESEWMEAVDEEVTLGLRETPTRIEIEPTELPELGRQGWLERLFRSRRISYDLTLTITVPEGTPLEVENRYGDVTVENVRGALTIGNTSGSVVVSGTRGETRLMNRYGDLAVDDVDGALAADVGSGEVEVSGVTGEAEIRGRYGDVTVRDVGGTLDLQAGSADVLVESVGSARIASSYGDTVVRGVAGPLEIDVTSGSLTVSGVEGRLDAANSYADVDVEDVEGDLVYRGSSVSGSLRRIGGRAEVTGSYGDLVLEKIGGTLDVRNTSGGVTVTDAGATTVEGSYAPIRLRRIRGDLRVTANSAAVVAREITGAVSIRTTYDSVRIEGAGGAVTVINQSGRVEVAGLTGDALTAAHRVETSYADVEITWPSAAELQYRLASTYGDIRGDLPGTSEERGSRRVKEGRTAEAPLARLDVSVQSGSITVRRR